MMKKITLLILDMFLSSCSSNKYRSTDVQRNFEKLKAGQKYVFFHGNNLKSNFEITSIEKDSIIGSKNKNRIALAKTDIQKVRKNNTAGTVILTGTAVGVGVGLYVIFKAVADIGKAIGPSDYGE